ncbi:MAG: hypothetical protein ISR58_09445 [Anaerolineales bacterium]|nr:hypothetical protein [Chloroflexota bacterium]MBL6981400.1 hypothetical protein [Anaerolineales bacterium]
MKNRLILLVIGIFILTQVMCRALPDAEQALETESPSPTAISLPPSLEPTFTLQPATLTHTSQPTITPYPPTITPTHGPTSTPTIEFVAVGEVCLPEDASVTIDSDVLMDPDFDLTIAEYLSAGGNVNELEKSFALQISSGEKSRVRVIPYDITGDGILDVLMTLTIPYGNGLGESHVLAFRCVGGGYESDIFFRRAGAGERAEGLFTGGGAVIKSLADINKNGIDDILFEVNWPGYQEYYLLAWDGAEFKSLIYYVDILGMEKYRLEVADGNIQIMDINEDGIFELEVTGIDFNTGNMATVIWRWDGALYFPEP